MFPFRIVPSGVNFISAWALVLEFDRNGFRSKIFIIPLLKNTRIVESALFLTFSISGINGIVVSGPSYVNMDFASVINIITEIGRNIIE